MHIKLYFWRCCGLFSDRDTEVQGHFCSLYFLCFCSALNKELVFQVSNQSNADVSLKQDEKEVSLMKKGKKKFSLHALAIMFECFSM